MQLVLKKAVLADIPVLNQISVSSKMYWDYPKEWLQHWMEGLIVTEKNFTTQQVYKLTLAKEIIGFSAIEEFKDYYEIDHLWILPKYIGKGYGKFLLNKTIENTVIKNKNILVVADPNAEAFYASHGFVTFDKTESYPPGRYLPIMKKQAS